MSPREYAETLIRQYERLAAEGERDASGQSLAVAETTSAARQVKALSHPGLLLIRRPYDVKAKRFPLMNSSGQS